MLAVLPALALAPALLGSAATAASASAATVSPAAHVFQPSIHLKWIKLFGANTKIATSSPNVATLDGAGPSVVVGSRSNGCVYAVHLTNGSYTPGWPRCVNAGVDSTPSVAPAGNGLDDVYVTSGDTAGQGVFNENCAAVLAACEGSLYAFSPNGSTLYARYLPDHFSAAAFGSHPAIAASPTIGNTGNGAKTIVVGGVDASIYAVNAGNGGAEPGWPQQTADTTFATAAIANVNGRQEIIAASDSTAGPGGLDQWNGGSVRAMTATGQTLWTAGSDEVITGSPAVGNLDGTGAAVAFGHGDYWWHVAGPGAAVDADAVTVVNAANGAVRWKAHTGGFTRASPALADLTGNGQLDVVEPTWYAESQDSTTRTGGVVFAYTPSGHMLWGGKTIGGPATTITGGVATANFGEGYQDVVVATGAGWGILDGRTGTLVDGAQGLNINYDGNPANLTMNNSPLVTPDPSGRGLDVVIAGTYGGLHGDGTQGFVAVYQVTSGGNSVGSHAWPMFHHDPGLTGSSTAVAPPPGACHPNTAPCTTQGYWMVASDGGIFNYGAASFMGSMGGRHLNRPIVGITATPDRHGYWMVASDGGIFSFGDASFHGSTGAIHLNKPIVGMATTGDGKGYWLVASDGGVFAFGDAKFHGSTGAIHLNKPIVGMSPTPDGGGYYLVASDGGVFAFGDAKFHGSMGGRRLNRPIVAIATTHDGQGYWMVASDGGIFNFGDAGYHGSTGAIHLNKPIVAMSPTRDGRGYWLVASDGGVFNFGDAYFRGSAGGLTLSKPVLGVATMG